MLGTRATDALFAKLLSQIYANVMYTQIESIRKKYFIVTTNFKLNN